MLKRKDRKFRVLRLEVDMSYPFPAIIGIASTFTLIAFDALLRMPDFDLQLTLPAESINPALADDLAAVIQLMATHSAVVSVLNSFYVILLLVPLLMAFNFALGFSNGQIRMLLSYPIGREKAIITKWGLIFIIPSTTLTLGAFFGLVFLYPYTIDIILMGQLLVPLWINIFLITTSCLLVAVLIRSAPLTALAGIGLWLGSFVIFTMQSSSSFLLNILFPFLAAVNYLNPDYISPINFLGTTSLSDALTGSVVAFMLGVLFFGLSVYVFRKLEV